MNTQLKLTRELEELKYELSVSIPQELREAGSLSDSHESSNYVDIINKQHYTKLRIQQLSVRLQCYDNIVISSIPENVCHIGSIISVKDKENRTIVYKIVECDINDVENENYQEITLNSPIGKALKNKCVGDEITVILPKQKIQYKILSIKTIHHNK